MKFGVISANVNAPSKIAKFAKVAEASDFDHFLLSDHYWLEEEPDMLDSWALLAYLTGITSTIKLGTCVTPITFRPPLQFAKVVTTLDNASAGRIIVGVGAGWGEREFRMFSRWHPYKERYAQFQEALHLLTAAWTEKSFSFSGRFYKVDDCIVEPKPIQKPYPPLLFGGWSNNRIVRLAGKMGDGWTPTGPRSGEAVKSPVDYKRFVQQIEKGLEETGRDRERFAFGCRFGPFDDPKDHLPEIEAFTSAGLNCYQLGVNVKRYSEETIRKFGDSVIASF